jgi:hypothetical protein
MVLRKDRLEFYTLMLLLTAAGWVGGFFASAAMFLVVVAMLWNTRRYDDIFLAFLLTLVFSDNLPDQFAGLGYAKQLKNIFILTLAATVLLDRTFFKKINPFITKFLPFFIIAVVALYASENHNVAIQKTLSYFLLFITIPTYVEYCYKNYGPQFFKRIIYLLTFIVTISILMKYLMPEVAMSHGGRLRGIFGNPNGLGIFVVLTTISFAIISSFYKELFSRWQKIFFPLLFLIVAYWSGSRSALLSIILFYAFYQIFKASLAIGILAFLAVAFYNAQIIDFFIDLIISVGFGDSFRVENVEEGSGRIIAWEFAWIKIQDYYYLGRGFSYDEHLMRANFDFLSRKGHEGGVHNTYLILWLNTGLIGLILYFRAFFLSFIQAARRSKFAFPAMFGVMFTIIFEPWLASSLNPFTSIFLMIIVVLSQESFYILPEDDKVETIPEEDLGQEVAAV